MPTQHFTETNGALEREFICKDFTDAVAFVNRILPIAEDMNHHPDVTIHHYNKVLIRIYHHDGTALNEGDSLLAERVAAAFTI
ncbi:MAG: 4a-hydroxytetrahydrobiopterin dehydratase [Candidatus Pacebacteria bacterium]|nr:4a-hydroxytetrahydrobiopterin dehydratase [Candidatus Paceibacterota bacterium]